MQRSKCALQVAPEGAYRLTRAQRYHFSPGSYMLSHKYQTWDALITSKPVSQKHHRLDQRHPSLCTVNLPVESSTRPQYASSYHLQEIPEIPVGRDTCSDALYGHIPARQGETQRDEMQRRGRQIT